MYAKRTAGIFILLATCTVIGCGNNGSDQKDSAATSTSSNSGDEAVATPENSAASTGSGSTDEAAAPATLSGGELSVAANAHMVEATVSGASASDGSTVEYKVVYATDGSKLDSLDAAASGKVAQDFSSEAKASIDGLDAEKDVTVAVIARIQGTEVTSLIGPKSVKTLKGRRVFVTAATFNGNLGGVAGADEKCMADANKPVGIGSYKAMLETEPKEAEATARFACKTTPSCSNIKATNTADQNATLEKAEHNDWVFRTNAVYTRTDGTLLGKTGPQAVLDLVGAQILNGFGLAAPVATAPVTIWTGSGYHWQPRTNETCASWTSDKAGVGRNGDGGARNTTLLYSGLAQSCDKLAAVICVEQ